MRFVVMECHLSYAVVLSEDGRFLKVANMHYQVGQTVTDVVEMQAPQAHEQPEKMSNHRWIYSLAAIAACLVLAVTGAFRWGQTTYASVYMTINPQVRIDVNRSDTVVGLEGMNEDGKLLIEDYSYRKKHLDLVMDELVDLAIVKGYLHEGGQITLMLDAEDNEWVISRSDSLGIHLNDYLTEKISVTIEVNDRNYGNDEVVIPIESEVNAPDSKYGNSDYGELPATDETTDYPENGHNYSDSAYENSTDAQDDGQTDYGQTNYSEVTGDDGQSPYEELDRETTSGDGQSAYEEPGSEASPDDGESAYEESDREGDSDDGQSAYEEPDRDADSDDGQSDYEEDEDDD